MTKIQSSEICKESGRYEDYGEEMLRIKDRQDREMLYGPTNEEQVTDICRSHVKSYRALPLNLYHIQWKFRDEVRPRSVNQQKYWQLLKDDKKSIVIAHGPAGCGKTLLATQNGIDLMKLQKLDKIVITRPVVGADEDIGFLPGSLQRKMEPWTRPLVDIFHKNYTVNLSLIHI